MARSKAQTQAPAQTLSIKQAAALLDLSEQRVRAALKAGQLSGSKKCLEGTSIEVWATTQEAVEAYRTEHGTDSRSKAWIVRLTPEQFSILRPKLDELGVDIQPRYTYDAEASRAYRERRKQKSEGEVENAEDEG